MSRSIERVASAAAEAGLAIDIRRMGESTRTAEEAARQCGCEVDQIVKSLVFAGTSSGRLYLFLVSGSRRLDPDKAGRLAGEPLERADPRRILLLTFSRRAAGEMSRRVERIAGKVLGVSSGALMDSLTWAGTFHGIGARRLREHAHQIGIDPAFTEDGYGDVLQDPGECRLVGHDGAQHRVCSLQPLLEIDVHGQFVDLGCRCGQLGFGGAPPGDEKPLSARHVTWA
jgi:hypothetical protein